MKKIISVMLCLALVLSSMLMMIPVNAESTPEGTAITDANGLLNMSATGQYYLAADIEWPAMNYPNAFKGTLDGNGHKITVDGAAIFKEIAGGTVKNLTIDGAISISTKNENIAALAIDAKGTFQNITSNVNIAVTTTALTDSYSGKMGGLVACITGPSTFENCVNNGDLDVNTQANQYEHYVGGIIGASREDKVNGDRVVLKNCQNTGAISSTQTKAQLGGLIGFANRITLEIDGCTNSGAIYVQQWKINDKNQAFTGIGGMIGGTKQGAGGKLSVLVINSKNTGAITAEESPNENMHDNGGSQIEVRMAAVYAGGIIGRAFNTCNLSVINCTNEGNVTASFEDKSWCGVGGLAGTVMTIGEALNSGPDEGEVVFENFKNTGTIYGRMAGGVVGATYQLLSETLKFKVQYCENEGSVTGKDHAAGIFALFGRGATLMSSLVIKNCKNSENVKATMTAAGILGAIEMVGAHDTDKPIIESCLSTGRVETEGANSTAGAANKDIAAGILGRVGDPDSGNQQLRVSGTGADGHTVPHSDAENGKISIEIKNCIVTGQIVKANDTKRAAITINDNASVVSTSGNIYKTGIAPSTAFGSAQAEPDTSVIKTSVANTGALVSILSYESEYIEADYTAETWGPYATALAAAKAALERKETTLTQQETDDAVAALVAAINALVVKPVDYTELDKLIADVAAMNKDEYTSNSFLRVENAVNDAKELRETATRQSQINAVVEKIKAQMDRLEKKSNSKKDQDEENPTTDPTEPDAPAATDALVVEEMKSGCGSAITATAVVLATVAALGAGVSFKKKED